MNETTVGNQEENELRREEEEKKKTNPQTSGMNTVNKKTQRITKETTHEATFCKKDTFQDVIRKPVASNLITLQEKKGVSV